MTVTTGMQAMADLVGRVDVVQAELRRTSTSVRAVGDTVRHQEQMADAYEYQAACAAREGRPMEAARFAGEADAIRHFAVALRAAIAEANAA